MLHHLLVGIDVSTYSTAAVELGIRWAEHYGAGLVGLGVIDAPTICKAQPVPLGATAYKVQRDKRLLADATKKVALALEGFTQQCAKTGVICEVRQEVGAPAERLLSEAQESDLMLLGQQTFFRFETQATPDDTLSIVVKHSPCPIVAVPAILAGGQTAIIAYDGSLQATRALHMFEALGLHSFYDLHVVCVDTQQERATHCVGRALAFLHGHGVTAQAHALATSAAPAEVLLEQVHRCDAGLLVMGAYGRSSLREFFGLSLTRTMLAQSPVPLFLYH
jgi:nucleotide-binding universal stress UspA family protein